MAEKHHQGRPVRGTDGGKQLTERSVYRQSCCIFIYNLLSFGKLFIKVNLSS